MLFTGTGRIGTGCERVRAERGTAKCRPMNKGSRSHLPPPGRRPVLEFLEFPRNLSCARFSGGGCMGPPRRARALSGLWRSTAVRRIMRRVIALLPIASARLPKRAATRWSRRGFSATRLQSLRLHVEESFIQRARPAEEPRTEQTFAVDGQGDVAASAPGCSAVAGVRRAPGVILGQAAAEPVGALFRRCTP